MAPLSIAGEWRGHYEYRNLPDHGCGFSAFVSETSGQISGTILDDFAPGEASLQGTYSFPSLQFTKVYLKAMHAGFMLAPIEYVGTLSDDGKMISGTWTIKSYSSMAGTWTAHRLNEEQENSAKEETRRIKEPQLEDILI